MQQQLPSSSDVALARQSLNYGIGIFMSPTLAAFSPDSMARVTYLVRANCRMDLTAMGYKMRQLKRPGAPMMSNSNPSNQPSKPMVCDSI